LRPGRLVLASAVALAAAGAFALNARATVPVTWCGSGAPQSPTDRTPELTAGPQVHVVYAHASDQPDRIARFADAMASDAASAAAWWTAQDPTRTLRYDFFGFANCSGFGRLDISDVTLAHDSAYFQPLEVAGTDRYEKLVDDLRGQFGNPFKKYVVYYDGPVTPNNVCGEGGGDYSQGPDYAMVFLQSCSLETQSLGYRTHVATHELIHALGAVRSGAPDECTGANVGHVCDSVLDIMYWQAQANTTIDTDILDVDHKNYYGYGGSEDIRQSAWLSHLDTPQFTSTVTIKGGGSVASDLPGIDCPDECSNTWDSGSVFTLMATPADGARFVGWSGACTGAEVDCDVTMDAAKSVTATFANGPAKRRLAVSVTGRGTVSSTPAGISCPRRCSASLASDTTVLLRAKPAKGYRFVGWSGDCRGKSACSLTLSTDRSARATFRRR
jgi:Divergent InlB B-repeat domain